MGEGKRRREGEGKRRRLGCCLHLLLNSSSWINEIRIGGCHGDWESANFINRNSLN